MYTFIIHGRIKPYTRMTQRSKWRDPQALEYLSSQDAIRVQLRQQMVKNDWEMLPERTPLILSAGFFFPSGWHRADCSNRLKAIEDAANGIVWKDDRWIDLYDTVGQFAGDDYLCVMTVNVLDYVPLKKAYFEALMWVVDNIWHGKPEELAAVGAI